MQNKPSAQQKAAQGAFIGLLISIGIWIGLVWRASLVVRAATADMDYDVAIGPLVLSTVSRHISGSGYIASISIQSGLVVFGLICLVAGGVIGGIAYHIRAGTR